MSLVRGTATARAGEGAEAPERARFIDSARPAEGASLPTGAQASEGAVGPEVKPASSGPLREDAYRRRLLWHCRRGMKELDVLLERFALEALAGASAQERQALAELLDLPDTALAAYLLGGRVPPQPHLAQLVRRITRA